MRRLLPIVALIVLASVPLTYRAVEAETIAACGTIQTLIAAADYTFATWPNAPADTTDLRYFVKMARADQEWCAGNPSPNPLVSATILWHVGNAGELLRQYQAVVQGTPIVPTETATPTQIPSATPVPTNTASPTSTVSNPAATLTARAGTPTPTATPAELSGPAAVTATAASITATATAATAVAKTATAVAKTLDCTPTISSKLVSLWEGYKQGNVYTLANGQQWKQVGGTTVYTTHESFPNVQVFAKGDSCEFRPSGEQYSAAVVLVK